jgi:hypothetical protein
MLSKYTLGTIMEAKIRNHKYFHVFNIVGTTYRGLRRFILADKYVGFSMRSI